mgnify:CR=1 FL=1
MSSDQVTQFDLKKATLEGIESLSGVMQSISRQRKHIEHEMERMSQVHDDLMKVEGYVRREMAQMREMLNKINQQEKEAGQ